MPWLMIKCVLSILQDYQKAIPNLSICITDSDEIPVLTEDVIVSDPIGTRIETAEVNTRCMDDDLTANINDGLVCVPSNFEQTQYLVKRELEKDNSGVNNVISICDETHADKKEHCFTVVELALMEMASTSVKGILFPSYSAYNSIINERESPYSTANILMFPLIPGPADSYSAIYTAFKLAQNVTTHVIGESSKTIISLDLDLYERALRFRNSSPELLERFILRLGQLHILFAHIRAIGRFLENTGIDDLWLRSELIGPNTIRQILTCSHVKRSVIVHEVTLLSLFKMYVAALLKTFSGLFLKKDESLVHLVTEMSQKISEEDVENIQDLHAKLVTELQSEECNYIFDEFENEQTQNAQFQMLRVYMNMIQRMLIFVHASRSKNWLLHLHATEELMCDIRSMDRIKYSRLIPVYLAEMYSLKSSDPVVWDAFSAGEFSVQKTAIPFTALGMDHAGEQVNKILKIEGGLTGVSRNENARTRYFLTAPLISQIASNFRDKNNEKKHHQNNKTYSKRQSEMKEKLCSVLRQYNVTFDNNMEAKMHNFITKQVFSDEIKKDVISVESIGKAQYKMFVDERLSEESNISVWAPVHKLNLNVCSKANKKTRLKVEDKLVEVTGQRLLFSRCAVVANSSRDLDMKSVVGDYELDVVPRSLMASDGSLHSGSENKSDLIERITNNYSAISCSPEPEMIAYRVAIIDAMVVVQKIAAQDQRAVKSQKIKTCLDFSNAFLNRISTLIKGFQEVRVVFDFYDSLSLKNATREKRGSTSGATRFIVDDNTRISSSVSQILKDIHTKQDLTVYLAEKSRTFLNKEGVRHLVSANHETLGNLPCSDVINNHEEADTLMIWHCIHFSLTSPNSSSLTVFSPDTDVACLLISFKKHMIQNVYLDTGNHIICINSVHQCLGERKADALLSLHALSGCDTTGRFLGKGKKAWWNVFNKCTDEQLLAISSIQSENPLNHIDLIEEVIAMLYCPKSTSIRDARWDLFRKRYHESERLPPTKGSIKQAVLRAHCQARPWYLSDKSVRTIPDPLECGWEICEGTYVAITSDHPIAPDLVINLVKCGCNSECLTNRCKCGKNKLVCTGLCECNDTCENTDTERFTNDDNLDEEEMFEEMLL